MPKEIRIAYIGGGSKMWAHTFMKDLSLQSDLFGEIRLYDIDLESAKRNKKYGEILNSTKGVVTKWNYIVKETIDECLTNADLVIISILPGTFKEMMSDVNNPKKYGILQSVGDTTGPGGVLRAMRTVPIYEGFSKKIKEISPNAWVINLTNPMALCVKTLYDNFKEIKAFGCCHEVFHAEDLLCSALKEIKGISANRRELKCDISGINHFTWMKSAYYKDIDCFKVFNEFIDKYFISGYYEHGDKDTYLTNTFAYGNRVKMDLFLKYHALASAGDRHLVEFLDNELYLKDEKTILDWHFRLTPVENRIVDQENKIKKINDIVNHKIEMEEIKASDEEAVDLIKALFGFKDITSNVNLLNSSNQVDYLDSNAVVESNAHFSLNKVTPIKSGRPSDEVIKLIKINSINQNKVYEGIKKRDLSIIFEGFSNDPLLSHLSLMNKKELFNKMIEDTKEYLIPYYKDLKLC